MFLLTPIAVMWYITRLAETNRSPFDLAEGESELVSGFNIEYGGGEFAFLFIAEYGRILFIRVVTAVLFMGSYIEGLGVVGMGCFLFISYGFL